MYFCQVSSDIILNQDPMGSCLNIMFWIICQMLNHSHGTSLFMYVTFVGVCNKALAIPQWPSGSAVRFTLPSSCRPSSLPARVAFRAWRTCPSRETSLGPGAKKDGCFRMLSSCTAFSLAFSHAFASLDFGDVSQTNGPEYWVRVGHTKWQETNDLDIET